MYIPKPRPAWVGKDAPGTADWWYRVADKWRKRTITGNKKVAALEKQNASLLKQAGDFQVKLTELNIEVQNLNEEMEILKKEYITRLDWLADCNQEREDVRELLGLNPVAKKSAVLRALRALKNPPKPSSLPKEDDWTFVIIWKIIKRWLGRR